MEGRQSTHGVTVEHLPITVEHLPITVEHLPITVEHLPITVEQLPITVEQLPITVEHSPTTAELVADTVELPRQIPESALVMHPRRHETCGDDGELVGVLGGMGWGGYVVNVAAWAFVLGLALASIPLAVLLLRVLLSVAALFRTAV